MEKVRMVISLTLGKANSGEKIFTRIEPAYMKSAVGGNEVYAPIIYIDKNSVKDVRRKAHKIIDSMCDIYE